jgi:sugar phosphate isomerase/epimerase
MRLGAMNDPGRKALPALREILDLGFDYPEVAVEGPGAFPETLRREIGDVKALLQEFPALPVVHIPWYFEIGSPYPSIRRAFVKEVLEVIEVASLLDAEKAVLHLSRGRGRFVPSLEENLRSLQEIAAVAAEEEIRLAVENFDPLTFSPEELGKILEAVPEAGFTLDLGHAHLGMEGGRGIFLFLEGLGERLIHLHVHDNRGGEEDLHLPIGDGTLDWKSVLPAVRRIYDGTVTLEIHTPEREVLEESRRRFLDLWRRAGDAS